MAATTEGFTVTGGLGDRGQPIDQGDYGKDGCLCCGSQVGQRAGN